MAVLARLGYKDWPEAQMDALLGEVREVHLTYAADDQLRQWSASGGSVTALLIHLLESDQIDGALVLTAPVIDGKVTAQFTIATSRKEIIAAQGSKYLPVHFAQDAMPLIRAFEGRLAVVALPCDAKVLHRARQRDDALDDKVKLVITLICGHNSEAELTQHIVRKIGGDHGELKRYHYRSGHWRGHLTAEFQDGTRIQKPFGTFSVYRNLYLFAQPKCNHCFDHYGYYCDISAGDIWSMKMKKEPIKHTALIARTDAGVAMMHSAFDAGTLHHKESTKQLMCEGQSRTAPFHYNISSRSKVAPLFGMRIKDPVKAKVRLPDYLVATLALFNQKMSRSKWGRKFILMLPRPVLKAYLYFFKGLELL